MTQSHNKERQQVASVLNTKPGIARREFIAGAAAAAAFTIVKPSAVRGDTANSTIEIGLVGCGGRGRWIADLFNKHGGYKVVACADYYADHADMVGDKYGIPASHRHINLSACQKLCNERLDAVVIETPPYFHPIHAATAVAAGKHVYVAKPISVDVPGCVSIDESGKKATAGKKVFLVDFQTRANEFYREAVKRVHAGGLGKLLTGWANYPWSVGGGNFKPATNPDDRLRSGHWYCTRELSGDFIVEQNIHTLDVGTWILDAHPIKAIGAGGSQGLRGYGNIYDWFQANFWFPNGFVLSYTGNQCSPGAPEEIVCRIYGSKATIDTDYYSHAKINGPKDAAYEGGSWKHAALYTSGTEVNIKEFHEAITKGDCSNPTVAPSVRSNLTCILGRTAAYTNQMVTWDEMMKKNERWEPDLSGLKA